MPLLYLKWWENDENDSEAIKIAKLQNHFPCLIVGGWERLLFFILFFWLNRYLNKQQKQLQKSHKGQSIGNMPIIIQLIPISFKQYI